MTLEEPKFLVDDTLRRLGRWLRAAGYDTQIAADHVTEYYLLRQALNEGRLLLTKDEDLLEHRRAEGTVILLDGDTLEEDAEELNALVPINWQYNPLSRCMACNAKITIDDEHSDAAYFCQSCNQVFWEGAHSDRLRSQLLDWHKKFTSDPR